ncbi:MAG: ATP-grasp domain-containing protein [Deltaproteobacteria bacterium]|nr:ATP-grasp domain-containing protein [Deltaproteobacteria bacterium]
MPEKITHNDQAMRIALGYQLRRCPAVLSVGVRTNLADYSSEEKVLIQNASKVYFPTIFFADALDAMGKKTFPSVQCYRHLGNKIKQTLLFNLLDVPTPKTRLFYGKRQKLKIVDYFDFPCVGKMPIGSSKGEGVFLIKNENDLDAYLSKTRIAYIQQYIPIERDLRVVILGKSIVHAYWKESAPGEFRTNVAKGGRISLDPVPEDILNLALDVAIRCSFDFVGLDMCEHQ